MITRFAVEGYRSLRNLRLELGRLTVVTGANGAGKSNLLRALKLMVEAASGRVVRALAEDGGLGSALWAGPETISDAMRRGDVAVTAVRRTSPVAVKLGFGGDGYGYAIDLGLPPPGSTAFVRDPAIKAEALWTGPVPTPKGLLAERRGPLVRLRDETGGWIEASRSLSAHDSMMAACADARSGVDLLLARAAMTRWRFLDALRTDRDAPARRGCAATRTPALAHDGADVAAAVLTIRETEAGDAFDDAVSEAFDGAALDVVESGPGGLAMRLRQRGLLRPLEAAELSDGTLRMLMLLAALHAVDTPDVLVLNEPEASLHPSLLAPLAARIADASRRGQVLVISHAPALCAALERAGATGVSLKRRLGETIAEGAEPVRWTWPSR